MWTLLNLEFVELDSIRIWTVFELCFYSRLYGIYNIHDQSNSGIAHVKIIVNITYELYLSED